MDAKITYKSMKKHTWSLLAPLSLTLAPPGASGGTHPAENVSKNTQKNVFRSIKIRKQISVKIYSEKHLPLQNPLERGGLGEAHLDIYVYIYIYIYIYTYIYRERERDV